MTTETDARTVQIFDASNVYIHGLTSGPAAGWSFSGKALVHVAGTRIVLTDEAAARIADGIKAVVRGTYSELTGVQLAQMPKEDREGYEFSHVKNGVHGMYVRKTSTTPGEVALHRSDIVSIGR